MKKSNKALTDHTGHELFGQSFKTSNFARNIYRDEELKFFEALGKDDDLSAFIRAHLYIERALRDLLRAKLTNYTPLQRFTFAQIIAVCRAAAIVPPPYTNSLTFLNTLRNKLAHDLGASLDDDDVKNLYNHLPQITRATFVDKLRSTWEGHANLWRLSLAAIYLSMLELLGIYKEGKRAM